MGIRGNMWIKDSQNADVKGRCQIAGREYVTRMVGEHASLVVAV